MLKQIGSGDLKDIIYSIYGKDIASKIVDIEYEYEDVKITGAVGKPDISRANRQNQIFFVNGRYVKDKNLTAAVDKSYKEILQPGKFGFVILNLEINPQKLDVNVHPAKLEVRFQDENTIFKAVYHAIKAGLGQEEFKQVEVNTVNMEPEKYGFKSFDDTEKIEPIIKNKEEMSLEERINAINSLIQEISPQKNTGKIKSAPEVSKENSENKIEDIYKSGFIKDQIEEKQFSLEEQKVDEENQEYDEQGKEIKIGNTKISSNTQELEVSEINEAIKAEEQNTHELTEKNNEEKVEKLEEIPEEEEKDKDNENDEFMKIASDKLIEPRLNQNENTETIDVAKVKETLEKTPEITPEFEKMYKKTFGEDILPNKKEEAIKDDEEKIDMNKVEYAENLNQSLFESMEEYKSVDYKLIGTAFSTYIIIEIKDELYLINYYVAEERLLFEKLKENYYKLDERDSQFLLLPDIINLTNKQMDIAKENEEMFAKLGFDFDEFGDNTIRVTSVPTICENLNMKELFTELLNELDTVAVTATQEKELKFISIVAGKVILKTKNYLDDNNVDSVLQELLRLPNPFQYSIAKPLAIKMTKYDLERKFKRK